jgi:hypothetical protein
MDILNLETTKIATIFHVSVRTAQRWKANNKIPATKIKKLNGGFENMGIKIDDKNSDIFNDKNDNDATNYDILNDKIDGLTKAVEDLTKAIVESNIINSKIATLLQNDGDNGATNAKNDNVAVLAQNNTLGNSLLCGGKEGGDIGGGDSTLLESESIESKKEKVKKEKKTDYDSDSLFIDFWKQYPHKHLGENKKVCFAKWKQLSLADKELAIARIANYEIKMNGYTHKPEKYIANRLWEGVDDVIVLNPQNNHTQPRNFKTKSEIDYERGAKFATELMRRDPMYAHFFNNDSEE